MKSKFLGDILTDDTGKYFDLGSAIAFFLGIALAVISAYDDYQSWETYHAIVGHILAITPGPGVSIPAIPAMPVFPVQQFGMAAGAILGGFATHKWASGGRDRNDDTDDDYSTDSRPPRVV